MALDTLYSEFEISNRSNPTFQKILSNFRNCVQHCSRLKFVRSKKALQVNRPYIIALNKLSVPISVMTLLWRRIG